MQKIFTILFISFLCIFQTHAAISITDTITASCNSNGAVNLGASGGTAPYRFKVSLGAYQSSGVFSGLGYGRYTFYVEDAAGLFDSITLTVSSTFSVAATYNSSVPSISAVVTGGAAPYQYLWPGFYQNAFSDSSEIRGYNYEPIFPGTYLVQVKDNNGCLTADSLQTVNGSPGLTVSIKSGSSCYTQQDDSIVLNGYGVGELTYQLGSTLIAGDFPQNVYPFTGSGYSLAAVNDANNDFYATYYHYYEPAPVKMGASINHASGAQQHNGSISLTVWGGQGGYTYRWSNGARLATDTGLAPGTYTVTVTEIGGCSVTAAFIVGPPVLSETAVNVSCNGDSTGQVNLAVIGAYSPYVFNVAGGNTATAGSFSGLPAGTYTFYVTDSTGAQDSVTATITQPTALAINPTIQNADSGQSDGFISVSISGGTPPYAYTWSVGNGNQNYLSDLYPGIYTVTVTDAYHCTTTATYNIVLTGIEQAEASHISLQPNPTTGVIIIDGLLANQSLMVYDANGRLVGRTPVTAAQQTINLGAQAAGVYMVRILNAAGICTAQAKVVKQ